MGLIIVGEIVPGLIDLLQNITKIALTFVLIQPGKLFVQVVHHHLVGDLVMQKVLILGVDLLNLVNALVSPLIQHLQL